MNIFSEKSSYAGRTADSCLETSDSRSCHRLSCAELDADKADLSVPQALTGGMRWPGLGAYTQAVDA